MKHKCGRLRPLTKRFLGNLRTLKQFSKNHHSFRDEIPASKIFNRRWPFRYRCRSEGERIFLNGRIDTYLYSRRKGNFKLPAQFRELESEISKLTRSELRKLLLPKVDNRVLDCEFNESTIEWSEALLPGTIWRAPRQSLDACHRRVDTHRLSKRDVPRDTRSLWPSFPTISEMVEMSRCGQTASGIWNPRIRVPNSITVQQARASRVIATRMIQRNVVGIRSTVPVPRQFLPWFRHRWGILFLSVRHDIPIGLVRFLTSQWIRFPFSLWLNVPCRYKYYLKLHDRADFPHSLTDVTV